MNEVPAEVSRLIIRNLCDTEDLQNARLVSKELSALVTPELFSKVYIPLWQLYIDDDHDDHDDHDDDDDQHESGAAQGHVEGDDLTVLDRLRSIIAHPKLCQFVRHVIIQTSEDLAETEDEDDISEQEESMLTPAMRKAISLSSQYCLPSSVNSKTSLLRN